MSLSQLSPKLVETFEKQYPTTSYHSSGFKIIDEKDRIIARFDDGEDSGTDDDGEEEEYGFEPRKRRQRPLNYTSSCSSF